MENQPIEKEAKLIDRIRWQGHGSFTIETAPFIQIAPWRVVKRDAPPDVILIGHDYYTLCSPADVAKIRGQNTVVIGSESVARIIPGTTVLREWQSYSIDRASIKAIPAISQLDSYGLGFLISLDLYDIYYLGDSAINPEVAFLRPDIVMLPIDGYGSLSLTESLQLLEIMQPKWAIPYNWGGAGEEATQLDAQSFKSRAPDATEVLLLPVSQ